MLRRSGLPKNRPSKNQSRNPARRARMSISATMLTTMNCPRRCRRNSALPNRPRPIATPETIRRVAKKPVARQSRADKNRGERLLLARSRAGPNQAVQDLIAQNLAPSAVMNRGLNRGQSAKHPRNVMNPRPARRAMPATIAPASAFVSNRRVKSVLPDLSTIAPSVRVRNNLALIDQLAPTDLPATGPLLPRAPSVLISHRVSAMPNQSPRNPPLVHLRASRLANPRKNSPRPRPVPHSPRLLVWV